MAIGILAAVAIPAYQDYIAGAQVSEAVSLTASGKVPIAEYCSDKSKWPDLATDVMGTTAGKYVSAISISFGASLTSSALTLRARMKSGGVNSALLSKTLELATTDGGKGWSCTVGDIDAKHRPSACR